MQSIIDYIELNRKQYPDHIAIKDKNRELTWNELVLLANTIASRLPHRVDRVGIIMNHSVEMIASILAVLKKGAGYVPVEPFFPKERIYYMMEESQADVIIANSQYQNLTHKDTVIVDEATHAPIAVLDGRDGESLKKWLKQNQHVTTVTRDRASAYAKAVEEILPDCMQIADRFHLHQNLMDAVNKVLNRTIPATTAIPCESNLTEREELSTSVLDEGKKNRIDFG